MRSAISRACSNDVAVPNAGAGRPAFRSTSPNAPRSSARSIAAADVPTTGTPAAVSRSPSPPHAARPPRRERVRQPQRGLPAELHDHPRHLAGLLLGVHDLEHVLE